MERIAGYQQYWSVLAAVVPYKKHTVVAVAVEERLAKSTRVWVVQL